MEYNQILENLAQYSEQLLLVTLCLLVVCLVIFVSFNIKLKRLIARYNSLMHGTQDSNLEEIMYKNNDMLEKLSRKIEINDEKVQQITEQLQNSVQKVAVVRFNAFPDMGSDLSFALALLDAKGDGLVMSCLAGRMESRTYCKPIKQGVSDYQLTDEEKKAIHSAMCDGK